MTLQFLVDGLMAGALIGLGAIGVTLTYSILGFANFAHGEFIAFGAYATLVIASAIGALIAGSDQSIGPLSISWAVIAASVAAMGLTGALALALDFALFRRLRGKNRRHFAGHGEFRRLDGHPRLARVRVHLAPAYFTRDLQIATPIGLGLKVTPDQIALLIVTAVVLMATHALLTRTQVGRAMRAVAENPALARVAGVNVDETIRVVWLLGAALACDLGGHARASRADPPVHGVRPAAAACSRPPFSGASAACPARFSAR